MDITLPLSQNGTFLKSVAMEMRKNLTITLLVFKRVNPMQNYSKPKNKLISCNLKVGKKKCVKWAQKL